ncbi:hypothetical protein LguiA_014793 [Lonicera macranthoides]
MEISPTPSPIHTPENLPNIAKIILYILKKAVSKTKLLFDLHLITFLKQTKLATKTLTKLILHHHRFPAAFTCRSTNLSFITPGDYEFSCTNSPIYPSYYTSHKFHHNRRNRGQRGSVDHGAMLAEKVFDLLNNNYEKAGEGSPIMLPGFGPSPVVRQLRVTDSPFPLKDGEEDGQVDKAAEEFISKFYKQLKLQKRIASVESPSPYHFWGR